MIENNTCEVCQALAHNEPLFETRFWTVTLSQDQGYLGRCYVTLKEHRETLSRLSDKQWQEFVEVVRKLESAMAASFGAKLFNWVCLMNNAYQKQPAQPHVHWHFRPRYDHKVKVGGMVFDDPKFGFHYDRNQVKLVDDSLLDEINQVISGHLL